MAFIKKIKVGGVSYDVSLTADAMVELISGYGIKVFSGDGEIVLSGMVDTSRNNRIIVSGTYYELVNGENGFYITSGNA